MKNKRYVENAIAEARGINPHLFDSKQELEEFLQSYRWKTYDNRYDITRSVRMRARNMYDKFQEKKLEEEERNNNLIKEFSKIPLDILQNACNLENQKKSGKEYRDLRYNINKQQKEILKDKYEVFRSVVKNYNNCHILLKIEEV